MKKSSILAVLITLFLTVGTTENFASTLYEDFENPSVELSSYNGGTITYSSGVWGSFGINKMNATDHFNDTRSVRMRGLSGQNTLTMMFDHAGAGVVSFNYGSYSNHSGGSFTLQQSTNGGVTWSNVGSAVTVPAWSGSFLTYSAVVNYGGNIRFRIEMVTNSNANTQVNFDDFQITDFNVDQTVMPTITPATGVYDRAQIVSISTSTPSATIYYTLDGTKPSTFSMIYTAPFNVSQTTKVRAMAISSGKENSREEVAVINIPVEVNTIAELYNYLPTSGLGTPYYKYTGNATVTFVYWVSPTNTAKKIFLQDNTAGILIDDNFRKLTANYASGDNVTGFVGQILNLNGAPIVYPYDDFSVVSSGNKVTPAVASLQDVPNRAYQLVQINGLNFDTANGTVKFAVNTSLTVHDSIVNPASNIVFNTPNSIAVAPDYIGTVVPAKTNVICLVGRNNTAKNNYYLFPRSLSDIGVPYLSSVINLESFSCRIYPEKGKIAFDAEKSEGVTIFNQLGQIVKTVIINNGHTSIDVPSGFYLVKVRDSVSKIVVF